MKKLILFISFCLFSMSGNAARESHGFVSMTPNFTCGDSAQQRGAYNIQLLFDGKKVTHGIIKFNRTPVDFITCVDHFSESILSPRPAPTVICASKNHPSIRWILHESTTEAHLTVTHVKSLKNIGKMFCQ